MFHPKGPSLRELAVQALSSTDRGYDLLAPKFEFTPFRTPDPVLAAAAEAAGAVDDAIDLCCGTGAGVRHLRARTRRRVVGIDRSAGMLSEARRLSSGAEGAAHLQWLRGDALELPLRSEAFDVATCFGAFGHILETDEERFVSEISRVLRPGGRFLFVTADEIPAWHPAYWVSKGFNAVMRVRNALRKPEFVMYYLTFLLPRATALLEKAGFSVEPRRGVMPKPFHRLVLVVATKAATKERG